MKSPFNKSFCGKSPIKELTARQEANLPEALKTAIEAESPTNYGSPFEMKYSSPVKQVSYEFPSTEATYGSNAGVVAAISGIGKIAGQAIKAEKAGEDLAEAKNIKADINKTKKASDTKSKVEKINLDSTLEKDVMSGLATHQEDFGLSLLPKLGKLRKR